MKFFLLSPQDESKLRFSDIKVMLALIDSITAVEILCKYSMNI